MDFDDSVSADDEARKLKDKQRKGEQVAFIHPRYGLIKCYIMSYNFTIGKGSSLGKVKFTMKLIRDKEVKYPQIRAEKRQAISNARKRYQSSD